MTQGRLGAFVRLARLFVLAAVALGWGASTLAAQAATGKIEGRVRDQAGQPIANAQVIIVGTAFGALTNSQGYYFINNVPAGTVSLRGSFIGYKSVELQDLRVLGGQTISADLAMEQTPFVVDEITVRSAQNVLVPRDEVTTKQRIDGGVARQLPADRAQQLLALSPGVVASASGNTILIRGGRADEAAVYVDGVPVNPGNRGMGRLAPTAQIASADRQIAVSTASLEEASITTGSSSAEFGNAQSGIVSVATRTGGSRFQGSLSYESDEIFPNSMSRGVNRVEGSLGGPLFGNLTFFVSGDVEGAKSVSAGLGSAGNIGSDRQDQPLYISAGVDSTVGVPSGVGDPTADTTYVDVLNFAAYTGDCDAIPGATAEIRDNYGVDCQGIRVPGSAGSSYRGQAKLNLSYGTGSRVAVTALTSQDQGRIFTQVNLFNPRQVFGRQARNQVFSLNWTQNLTKSTERALALDVALSYQRDRFLQSPFTREEEASTRSPTGGFMLAPLDFLFDFDSFPLDDQLVDNFRRNTPGSRRSPYNLEEPDQYNLVDDFRNNPYAVLGYSETGGPDGRLFMSKEDRYIGKMALDWQFDRYNRLKLGGEYTRYDLFSYSHQLTSQAFADVFTGEPVLWNVFAEDRIDLGDVVVVGGLRYDFYDSKAVRPYLCEDENSSEISAEHFGQCDFFPRISSFGYDGSDWNPDQVQFRADESHSYLSPHIQVAFPVTDKTNFRLSYAHQVQAPDWGLVYNGVNTDRSITNTNNIWGTDLDFGKTITFEFGVRHSFNEDMVLDIAAYNKDKLSDPSVRFQSLYDPSRNLFESLKLVTNADFGNTRGIDLRLDRRFGNYFNGFLGYTFQAAKNTGTDPFEYIDNGARTISALSDLPGGSQPPPQAILPTSDSRPHNLSGAFAITLPDGYREGTTLGALLQNFSVFTTFRFASGTAYTRCANNLSEANVMSFNFCNENVVGSTNGARLPSFKQLDMRFTKGFALGSVDLTGYLDVRNILNFENVLAVFAGTNDTRNALGIGAAWSSDSSSMAQEAGSNPGVLQADGSLDMTFGGPVPDASGCGNWVRGSDPVAPNCVYIIRAEQRFGDGDGTYTLAEQRRASEASYLTTRGLQALTGPPRQARLGIELSF